jgi:ADP-heptose:LPS heptosyltransferase
MIFCCYFAKLIVYRNILVIQTAFIGDAILASSLVEKLHILFPETKISILVRKGNEGIYKDHPWLKDVLVWDKTKNKVRNLVQLLFKIRSNKYDCVINCHRFLSSGFLTGFSGAKHKTGYKQTPFSYLFDTAVKHVIGNGNHEIHRYNQLIEDFTGTDVFKPRLYPSSPDHEKVLTYKSQPYVCMAPASVWFTKQMDVEKWTELCDRTQTTTRIYLLGATGDKDLCLSIKAKSVHSNIKVLAGELNLLESCALMKDALMNYVNDSAPLHLASSMNAPVTAFFCSTVPAFGFGPLSDKAYVIQVNELKCKPCGLHGYRNCPAGHFHCSKHLEISEAPIF